MDHRTELGLEGGGVQMVAESATVSYASPPQASKPNTGLLHPLKAGTDPGRPIWAAAGGPRVRECSLPFPKETCGCFPGPVEHSSSHFGTTLALGARDA